MASRSAVRLPPWWLAWPLAIGAVVLLNQSLTFANIWPTPKIEWQYALSVECAAAVLILAMVSGRLRGLARRILPAVWLLLVAGHYMDVTAPGLYGRPFNLYWDSAHLGNVAAMLAQSAPLWLVVAAVVGALLALGAAAVASHVTIGWLAAGMEHPRLRATLSASAIAVIVLFTGQQLTGPAIGPLAFADPVTPSYARQARSVLAMMGPGAVAPALPASPAALASPLDGLDGADVLLVFVESYGAITFETPAFLPVMAEARAEVVAAAQDTGKQVVSAFVDSPTFGASSWLAHLTLLTGVDVRDPYSYQRLMTESRDTLVKAFARRGYRTVAVMPGMRQPWPEGAFYGFDTIYGRDLLEYRGPEFGWWSIPDQFALARLDALETRKPARAPLFVVFPTSTTHAPFGPVAPYLSDWSRVLRPDAYDPGEVSRILSRPLEWTNLSADYGHAMAYEFTTFAGYLRQRANDDLVMILIGDHQPPAAVSGKDASWSVPVHVITNRSHVIEQLQARGFTTGLTPRRPALGGMHELVPMLTGAFEASPGPVKPEVPNVEGERPR